MVSVLLLVTSTVLGVDTKSHIMVPAEKLSLTSAKSLFTLVSFHCPFILGDGVLLSSESLHALNIKVSMIAESNLNVFIGLELRVEMQKYEKGSFGADNLALIEAASLRCLRITFRFARTFAAAARYSGKQENAPDKNLQMLSYEY